VDTRGKWVSMTFRLPVIFRPRMWGSTTSGAYAEALNGIIQNAQTSARGYATSTNMIAFIYLIAGKPSHLPRNPSRYAT